MAKAPGSFRLAGVKCDGIIAYDRIIAQSRAARK